jgi:FAD binding domain
LKTAERGSAPVTTKSKDADTKAAWAQGGIACVTSDEDSLEPHVRDTLEARARLCDEAVVRTMCDEAVVRTKSPGQRHQMKSIRLLRYQHAEFTQLLLRVFQVRLEP